jgi:hypothetical protein
MIYVSRHFQLFWVFICMEPIVLQGTWKWKVKASAILNCVATISCFAEYTNGIPTFKGIHDYVTRCNAPCLKVGKCVLWSFLVIS